MQVLGYTKFVNLTFFYRNKETVEVNVPLRDLKPHFGRLIERSGVLVLQGKKIDLTLVEKIIIDFNTSLAVM